jgi:hypothetical protein
LLSPKALRKTRAVSGSVPHIRYRIAVNTQAHHPATQLHLNEIALCEVALSAPIAFDPYTVCKGTGSFIIIDRLSNVTIGAGMILGPAEQATPKGRVTAEERAIRLGQRPMTLWLTGPNRSKGIHELERELFDQGFFCAVIDAELLGEHTALAAKCLQDAGLVSLVSAPVEIAGIAGDNDVILADDPLDYSAITALIHVPSTPSQKS